MKRILIIALSAIVLSSCSNKSAKNETTVNSSSIDSIENSNSLLQEDYDAIFTPFPDSLSVEQKELQHKLLIIMKENVKIKDEIIYSSATKEDFESQDIPLYYYDMLNKNLEDLNATIKNDSLNPQKFYDDMMKEFPEI